MTSGNLGWWGGEIDFAKSGLFGTYDMLARSQVLA